MSRSQGQQLSMYLFEGGRGAVASTSAAPEQNELRKCRRDSLIKLTHFVIPLTRIKCSFELNDQVHFMKMYKNILTLIYSLHSNLAMTDIK